MKKIIVLFIYINTIISFSQVKSGKATYGIISTLNYEKIASLASKNATNLEDQLQNKLISKILKDSKNTDDTEFELQFSNKIAFYKPIHALDIDSKSLNIIKIAAKASGDFFFDFISKTTLNSIVYKGKKFLVEDRLSRFDWEITNETKLIGNYNCIKALAQRKYYLSRTDKYLTIPIEAWFTLDIPVPAGPEGVGGLPGLIVELKLKSRTYYLKRIVISKIEHITKPSANEIISRKNYNAYKRQHYLKN